MRGSYRKKCLQEKGESCVCCGSESQIQVHHVDGDRTNDELDNLVPVCHDCHWKIHRGEYEEWHEKILPEEQRAAGQTLSTVSCPDELWESWKETVPRRLNLNDGLLKVLAQRTLDEREGELDEKTRQQIEEILDR